MEYVNFKAGSTEYKLRLNTRGCADLEDKLGKNPVQILFQMSEGNLPKLKEMALILHACLLPYQHGIKLDDVYDIFDRYMADGNTMFDIVPVFVSVFREAGFIAKDEEDEKN